LIKRRRKPAKIVDSPRCGADRDAGLRYVPMGGDAKDGLGLWYLLADRAPGTGVTVVRDRVQRVAVAEKYSGRAPCHDDEPLFATAGCMEIWTVRDDVTS
jgi:hypothetical protein